MRKSVAIIGSGISGLTACYLLKDQFDVYLFEKSSMLGMASHGAVIKHNGKEFRLDVPFRTMKRSYYPTLFDIYQQAGIKTRKVDYSFRVEHDQEHIFSFNSFRFGSRHFALPSFKTIFNPVSRKIFTDLIKFFKENHDASNLGNISIRSFLTEKGYSSVFMDQFLFPTFALINTCKNDTVGSYPAKSILQYNKSGLTYDPQETASHGTADAAEKLAAGIYKFIPNCEIKSITMAEEQISISSNLGEIKTDYLVCATQANTAAKLLKDIDPQRSSLLQEIPYEPSEVILHTDSSFFGKRGKSLVFQNKSSEPMPQVTLDLERIYPQLKGGTFFQTWNPHSIPENSQLLSRSKFERPIVNGSSIPVIEELLTLNKSGNNKITLCGSYMGTGIPLLEAGVKSAVQTCKQIA
jgi:uncharacterized protein